MRACSLVNEVKAEALHLRATVPEAVQSELLAAPVELGLPVTAEFLQVLGVRSVVPAAVAHGGRPPGSFEARLEIVDFLVRNGNREGFDVHHVSLLTMRTPRHRAGGRSTRGAVSVSAQVCTGGACVRTSWRA